MAGEDDIIKEAREAFEAAHDAMDHNFRTALEDITFARLGEQWPADIVKQREREGRPVLTINKLLPHIRQVVNDSRQNKPSMKVHPADSKADPETAKVIEGLLRNIEYQSNADVAYDTAVECAVSGGFGYWRVGIDALHDDALDMDVTIDRIANPFSVFGDPNSRAADSSDWNMGFITDMLSEDEFKRTYGDRATVSWDDSGWNDLIASGWRDDDTVTVAEYWTREEVQKLVVVTTNGAVYDPEGPEFQMMVQAGLIQVNQERKIKAHKVTQRIMTGLEVLKTTEWPGRFIPIVPVYGDEFDIEGKRYFRSLVHGAIDAQRMHNYWRTAATELVALAPKVPFIGPEGSFDANPEGWATANTRSHAYLEYSGQIPPQRQPLDMGTAAGSMQEAMIAADDIKSIIGQYDASLGARSNETSGKAILARQREGDVSTYHFIDNLSRAIRHTGRIVIDLIPKVYSSERIIRILGEDGKPDIKPVNQQYPATDPKTGQPMQQPQMGPDGRPMVDPVTQNPIMVPIMAMHDLRAGKYDLTVKTGPSYTTLREEAAVQMTELMRAAPQLAPIVIPELAKNLDWPGADEIADKIAEQQAGTLPPQAQKQMQEMQQHLKKLSEENQALKSDAQVDMAKLEAQKQAKQAELQQKAELAQMEIESEERIAMARIQSEARLKAFTAQINAEAVAMRPAPQIASGNA